ncbi:hypothetical protein GCM10010441_66010 [Kitasatospora paracochleata]|uniref:SseB protein N-terminal domain-containing protein n=1 Tax=Kitasatospora paracochleata TaxID=58354 RepID=A0ABT1J020_9ACTN|nr:SseB family protein [Kitasatospora paracochleata]MCP2310737.1 hypothetical protein [Kitasatospora paracochleata]
MGNAGLVHQLRMMHANAGDPDLLMAEFRAALLYVPQDAHGRVWSGDRGGIRWIHAFTSEAQLAAFAEKSGHREPELAYLTVRGSRLLDVAVPAVGQPAGVALDAAGTAGMLFPPMRGIVPDTAALDGGAA